MAGHRRDLVFPDCNGLLAYLRGRSDGKAKLRGDAEWAYRETRERMDAVDTGDSPYVARGWLSECRKQQTKQ